MVKLSNLVGTVGESSPLMPKTKVAARKCSFTVSREGM
jgi:hypothetical protein